jgi:hypothetical protein
VRRPQRTRNGPKCADWVREIKLRRRAKRQLPTLSGQRSFGARFALDKPEVGFRLPRRPTGRFGRAGRSLDDRHNHTQGPRERRVAAYAFIRCWRSPRSKSTGWKKLSTRRKTRSKGPGGGRRTTPRWWGPGSRGHRPSIARVLASLDSLIPPYSEEQHDVLRAAAHSSGNRRICRHPYYGSAINFRLPC